MRILFKESFHSPDVSGNIKLDIIQDSIAFRVRSSCLTREFIKRLSRPAVHSIIMESECLSELLGMRTVKSFRT